MARKEGGPQKEAEAGSPQEQKKGSPLILGIALVVVVLLVLAIGGYFFLQTKQVDPFVVRPPEIWPASDEPLAVQQTLMGGLSTVQIEFTFGVAQNQKTREALAVLDQWRDKIVDLVGSIIAGMDEIQASDARGREYLKTETKRLVNRLLRESSDAEIEEMYIRAYLRIPTGG